MNIVEHLEEVRKRIIRTLLAFLVAMVASFIYVQDIFVLGRRAETL
ncbi:twin-arginine translocase subunit TatC [Paenibacillus solisilvae]|uniref:Twin-arginine translocase subunit TatC n=1 Tax=Paenibacillus solisilvae TaxID=2486751 RepID=A0ABW0VVQ8_9BACL